MFEKFVKLCYGIALAAFSVMALCIGLDAVDSSTFIKKLRERRKQKKYSSVEDDEDED